MDALIAGFKRLILASIALCALIICASSCGGASDALFPSDDPLYLAIGASDALGVGALPPTDGYAFLIRDALDDELGGDFDLFIVAIPAAETDTIEGEFDFFLDSASRLPDVATVLLGSNDIIAGVEAEDYESELRKIIVRLVNETQALVVIGNIPDLTQLPRFIENPSNDVTPERIAAFNGIVEGLAGEFGIPLVDLFSMTITDDLLFVDGFHPSDEGHRRIAELLLEAIFANLN
ncbi:MAG: SGNH/GDSL hydrolase family protein [Deltaproteobacteria bacterium]